MFMDSSLLYVISLVLMAAELLLRGGSRDGEAFAVTEESMVVDGDEAGMGMGMMSRAEASARALRILDEARHTVGGGLSMRHLHD